MTPELPGLVGNLTKFVDLQGSIKHSLIVVQILFLLKSISFGSLHSKIPTLKTLVDISRSEVKGLDYFKLFSWLVFF